MALYETSWQDFCSVLVSAPSMGEALLYLNQHYGQSQVHQLEEIVEIKPDSFLLVRRCGRMYQRRSELRYQLCPDSPLRLFSIRRNHDQQQAMILVQDIVDLPTLLLWHFDYLSEEQCQNKAKVIDMWSQYSTAFEILELDTYSPGILLTYDYCCCDQSLHTSTHVEQVRKDTREKPH